MRVAGPSGSVADAIARTRADLVVVTIPEAPAERLAAIADACEQAGVSIQFVQRRFTETPPALAEAPLR